MEHRRPEIHIHYWNVEERYKREVVAGIEEEGLYSHCDKRSMTDPVISAYEAAGSSLLGVGISMMGEDVVLHMRDLHEHAPLIHVKTSNQVAYRILGSNAARYIKGIPFKDTTIGLIHKKKE